VVELLSNTTLFGWVMTQFGVLSVFKKVVRFAPIAGLSKLLFLTTITSWAFIILTEFSTVEQLICPEPDPVPVNVNVWFPGVVIVKLTTNNFA
jgi:hypothetical protein